jgi:predicted RNase H-like HicB family nuclease
VSRYLVVIERAGHNYSAYVPDLPGVVAAGDTPDEVRELMREAVEMHVDALREDGLPIPEATTTADWLETA